MWSDAARASSMSSRGAGGGPATAAVASPAQSGSGALQAGLAKAGAASRGQWAANVKGTHTHSTITGDRPQPAAHQAGVEQATTRPTGAEWNETPWSAAAPVAQSSYGASRIDFPVNVPRF